MSAGFAARRCPRGWSRAVACVLSIAGLALLVALPASCTTSQERYERRLANTGKPALHSIQSERLRHLMDRMRYDPLPQEMDTVSERDRRMRETAEVAGAMAEAARSIPDAIQGVQIDESERSTFLALARKLEEQSRELQDYARRSDVNGASRSLERVQSTCNACHTLFRIEPGMPK